MVLENAGHLIGKGKRFAIVVGRFNELVTRNLLGGALDCLKRHGVGEKDIVVYWVPGSFEIPQAARRASKTSVHARWSGCPSATSATCSTGWIAAPPHRRGCRF